MLLEDITIKKLKKICNIRNIKFKHTMRKKDIINLIIKHNAIIKIQKNIRFMLAGIKPLICPITLGIIKYPIYPYQPKKYSKFIYYDLQALIKYLQYSGSFIDPKTRQIYTDKEIELLNKLSPKKIILCNNSNVDDDILLYERCIDDSVSLIRDLLENNISNKYIYKDKIKSLLYFMRKMLNTSFDMIKCIYGRIIGILNETYKLLEKNHIKYNNDTKDFIFNILIEFYINNINDDWPY